MILFLQDWAYYPSAIVHTKTRNESFLRLAELYKRMGIKNYYFHLALMNPELEDVDPYDPNLTKDQKIAIGIECRNNPWYFFREVVRVPPQAGREPVPLRANRGNIALWWLFFNHIDIALIQPRQTGKSLSTDVLMEYLLDIATSNTDISMLTKDDRLRVANVNRLKEIRDLVPAYISQKTRKDSDNKQELTCVVLNNRYTTAVAQGSELAANNVGRGLTSPIMHVDEGPFCTYIATTIPAMLASGTAAREEAQNAGAPYGNIFTTTAGKKDTKSGRYMYDMIHGGMPWTEALFDCKTPKELAHVVEKNCTGRKIIVNATFSHRQLGKTDQWLIDTIRNVNATPEEADRDFFNVWTSGTASSPLTIELNEIIKGSKREPKYSQITKDGYILRWYIEKDDIEHYMANNTCILGMDTSEGIGRDAITMVLMNVKSLEVVAAAAVNEASLIRFSGFIADFMIRFKNVVLIPERRSSGQTFIDTLLIRLPAAGIDPFKRIFNTVVDQQSERPEDFKLIDHTDLARRTQQFYDRWKSSFGFATAGQGRYTRNTLYADILQEAARRGGSRVRDSQLAQEITSLVVKKGKIDHTDGGHDDMVIAWLLGTWMLIMGRNLSYYGINGQLSEAIEIKKGIKEEEALIKLDDKHRQEEIKAQMEELLDKIRRESNELVAIRYENLLRRLDSTLSESFSDSDSIDVLIEQAKEQRSQKIRRSRNSTPYGVRRQRNSYYSSSSVA